MTLENISKHMIDYMSSYDIDVHSTDYYDEDGHCGDILWSEILNYWKVFKSVEDFKYVVSSKWDGDFDMDGGRSYIFSRSGVIPLIFDYMLNTLKWSINDYENIIYNTNELTDEISELFDSEIIIENKSIDLKHDIWSKLDFSVKSINTEYDFIPRIVKYPSNMKTILDDIEHLNYISKSLLDDNFIIYEIKTLGVKIPKGYDIVHQTSEYGF